MLTFDYKIIMKWSQFIKDDNKLNSAYSSFKSSKRIKTQIPQLSIKSIQNMKLKLSRQKLFHNVSPSSRSSKDTIIKRIINKHVSQASARYHTNQNQTQSLSIKYPQLTFDFNSILQQFKKDFNCFLQTFLSKIKHLINNDEFKKQMNKSIISVSKEILQNPLHSNVNKIKKSTSCFQNSFSSITMKQDIISTAKKPDNIIIAYQKTEKHNNFQIIDKSIEKATKILGKQKKLPRFFRTSKQQPSKTGVRPYEDFFQPNIQESRKIHRSRMKSKDILYNMSKILNQ